MLIPLPIARIELGPGGTAALATPCGTGIRVVKGRVWATTTGSLDDVWLRTGEEHHVQKQGLTVIEASDTPATVELASPANPRPGAIRRTICGVAAVAMTVLTFALLVILPAQLDVGSTWLPALSTANASFGAR
jgi:Protein of unknown function (DUF2917)